LVHLEVVLVSAQARSMVLRRMYHRWYFYVTWVKWKLISVHLEIVLISMQDRCTVCDECTMGMEIVLGAPDGTPR
jgi:hypothetical protein